MDSRERLRDEMIRVFSSIRVSIESSADRTMAFEILPNGVSDLQYCWLVVDALGENVRMEILNEFLNAQLAPYDEIFGYKDDMSSPVSSNSASGGFSISSPTPSNSENYNEIQYAERRFAWFKRIMRHIRENYDSVFPASWNVLLSLAINFIMKTKIHLAQALLSLKNGTSPTSSDATIQNIIKALHTSLRFEQEIIDHFNLQQYVPQELFEVEDSEFEEKLESVIEKINEKPSLAEGETAPKQETSYFLTSYTLIRGGISNAFDPFLTGYVQKEKQELEASILKACKEEDEEDAAAAQNSDSTETKSSSIISISLNNNNNVMVFTSSTTLFMSIKSALKRCQALSSDSAFLQLSKTLGECMRKYMMAIKSRLPLNLIENESATSTSSMSNLLNLNASSTTNTTLLSISLLKKIIHVINTCEYCNDVIPQLHTQVQQQLSASMTNKWRLKRLASKLKSTNPSKNKNDEDFETNLSSTLNEINFDEEADQYMDVVASALKALIRVMIDGNLDLVFKGMNSLPWGSIEMFNDESEYIHILNNTLLHLMPIIKSTLSPSYFINFCSKLATEILDKFLDIIFKQKKISEAGSQQLLLDTYNLKTILLVLPILAPGVKISGNMTASNISALTKGTSPIYLKLITTKINFIETNLKLLTTPDDILIERFKILWPDGKPADLQRLLALKGTTKKTNENMLGMSKMFNKTANMFSSSSTSSTISNSNESTSSNSQTTSSTGNTTTASSSLAGQTSPTPTSSTSSFLNATMKSFTQDLSSSARNTIGNLKWGSNK